MTIREVRASDIPELKRIYAAQGIEYDFPDVRKMVGALVAVDDSGKIRMAMLARKMEAAEAYFLFDKTEWDTPAMKFEQFKPLHEAMREQLRSAGIVDVYAWVPPGCKGFARRMVKRMRWLWSDGAGEKWTGIVGKV